MRIRCRTIWCTPVQIFSNLKFTTQTSAPPSKTAQTQTQKAQTQTKKLHMLTPINDNRTQCHQFQYAYTLFNLCQLGLLHMYQSCRALNTCARMTSANAINIAQHSQTDARSLSVKQKLTSHLHYSMFRRRRQMSCQRF